MLFFAERDALIDSLNPPSREQKLVAIQSTMERWRWMPRDLGRAHVMLEAGRAFDPSKGCVVELPLPYGPKARLVMIHVHATRVHYWDGEDEGEVKLAAAAPV